MKVLIVLVLICSISCSKSLKQEDKLIDNAEIIDALKLSLSKDIDFIRNFSIDVELTSLQNDSLKKVDYTKYRYFINEVRNTKNSDELLLVYNKYGFKKAEHIISLIQNKAEALLKIKNKFPELSKLTKLEFEEIFVYSYRSKARQFATRRHRPGCTTNCCDRYVDAIGDCDSNFSIETAASVLAGTITLFVATPVGAIGAITTGIGTAYALLERCSRSAARDYRICMGYE